MHVHARRLDFPPHDRACGCPSPAAPALQIGLFLLAYAVYTVARFFTIGDLADATANAHWIVDLQNAVGVGVEASVQNALDGSWVMWVLNRLYLLAQLGVIPAVLIFLYNRSWAIYATLRNTILATWLISVPIYGLFPVAPPRLAGIGIEDTITSQTGMSMTSNFSTSFFNELAAVPSLHVGFAVAVGFALFAVLKNPVLRGRRCCGARSSAWRSSPPATTSSSTRSPASRPPRWATAWCSWRRGSASSARRRPAWAAAFAEA